MSRIAPLDHATTTGKTKDLLDAAKAQLGVVPNFLRVLAHSPQSLEGFLGFHVAMGHSKLDHATRERIALAVAEANGCQYCVSAHSAIGRGAGLDAQEMEKNRRGTSSSVRGAAIVSLARAINETGGAVDDDDLAQARAAGLSEEEIVEVLALVVLNIFTNTIGKMSKVAIDFPKVELLSAAAV